jgi:hypothetical protein
MGSHDQEHGSSSRRAWELPEMSMGRPKEEVLTKKEDDFTLIFVQIRVLFVKKQGK